MKRVVNCFAVLVVLAVLLCACTAYALTVAVPVTNGSFESPVVTGEQQVVPDGWTSYGLGQIYLYNNPAFAKDGNQVLEILQGSSGVYQDLTTPAQAGWTYTVSAWVWGQDDNFRWTQIMLDAVDPSNPNNFVRIAERLDLGALGWNSVSIASIPVPAAQNGWKLRLWLNGGYGWASFDQVTITRTAPIWSIDIPVANGSFESPVVIGEQQVTPSGWSGSGQVYLYNNPALAKDGNQVVELYSTAAVYQYLTTAAQIGWTYTLSAWIWGSNDAFRWTQMTLRAVNPLNSSNYVTLGERTGLGASGWHFESLTTSAVAPAQYGWDLQLVLTGGYGWSMFDLVTVIGSAPGPSAPPSVVPGRVAGTGQMNGTGMPVKQVGIAGTPAKEYRLAQSFTLGVTTKIQSIRIQTQEPSATRHGLPCDLRIYTANQDGTPTTTLANSNAWAWIASRPGSPYFYPFFFGTSFVLSPGRYTLVLSKKAENLPEQHYYEFPLFNDTLLPGETAWSWDSGTSQWQGASGDLSFAVYGYEQY